MEKFNFLCKRNWAPALTSLAFIDHTSLSSFGDSNYLLSIYKRYFNGEIKDVAGLDISVDYPDNPHLKIDFTRDKTPDVVSKIALDSFNEYNVNG